MALTPGTRLGAYEITGAIGAGGMGEVYRARDTKLGRDVALKILPEAFAQDPDRLARFKREAQVLALLNHPNIATIHGFEDAGGLHALVMELVEGPTLADLIAGRTPEAERVRARPRDTEGSATSRGGGAPRGLNIDDTLAIARQIADALEAAHEQGIVHRDLKPANVKVRDDGTVKVLDFGLAKAVEPAGAASASASALANSPTLTSPAMTEMGMILGTAAYMSPEQARGRPVDKRADIWAFGCVLFEMLTGRRAFQGEDVSLTLAAVLRAEVQLDALPDEIPVRVRQVVALCLQRDLKKRVPDIGAVRLALEGAFDTGAVVDAASVTAPPSRWWSQPRWVATGVVLGVLAGLGIGWVAGVGNHVEGGAPVRRLLLGVPASVGLPVGAGTLVALSPNGQTVVYRGVEDGVHHLYQRRLDQLDATIIAGTENAGSSPFFSPDSQSLAFTLGTSLMQVALAGGLPTRIADLGAATRGGSWGPDGTIVVAKLPGGLVRVHAIGGDLESLPTPDAGRGHWYPQILPGGRALLFTVSEDAPDSGDVFVLDFDTGTSRRVVAGGVAGHYTPTGHLVFLRGGDLWAAAFDLATLTVQGQPALVEQGIRVEPGGAVQFAVAGEGGLAYVLAGNNPGRRSVVWIDRTGREEPLPTPVRPYTWGVRVSPDGSRVALDVWDPTNRDIWIYDLARGAATRLTFTPEPDGFPLWTRDGQRIVFVSGSDLVSKAADGTGDVTRLAAGLPGRPRPAGWSSDGSSVVYDEAQHLGNIFLLPLDADRQPQALIANEFGNQRPALSPDGRWIAYATDESGRYEVYVRPFPAVASGRWQISTAGGNNPTWSPNGRELFYSNGTALMRVPIDTSAAFRPGAPEVLFQGAYTWGAGPAGRAYDIAPDGQRFLVIKEGNVAAGEQQIVVVENWFEQLKRLVPTE